MESISTIKEELAYIFAKFDEITTQICPEVKGYLHNEMAEKFFQAWLDTQVKLGINLFTFPDQRSRQKPRPKE